MKSPFPGMDPYLEQHWGDVHTSLIVYIRDQIDEQLPDDLQARVEECVGVVSSLGDHGRRYPDVQVVAEPTAAYVPAAVPTVPVAVATPRLVPVYNELPTQRHLQIIDTSSGGRLVTAIELRSPANKTTAKGRELYWRKQQDYLEASVNLVEIDLIRAGEFMLAIPEAHLPADCCAPYHICVRRMTTPNTAELYPLSLREPLPAFRVPLRPTDDDIVLQLQPLLDRCYRAGRYARLDYRQPPQPPLSAADEAWADALLRQAGVRP